MFCSNTPVCLGKASLNAFACIPVLTFACDVKISFNKALDLSVKICFCSGVQLSKAGVDKSGAQLLAASFAPLTWNQPMCWISPGRICAPAALALAATSGYFGSRTLKRALKSSELKSILKRRLISSAN